MQRVARTRENLILHFSPDAAPVCTVRAGESIVLETVDAEHLVKDIRTNADLIPPDFDEEFVTPSTGPIAVDGAEPGDTLVLEILDIQLASLGFTCLLSGIGLMRDSMRNVPLTRVYQVRNGYVEFSPEIRIAVRPMVGIVGTTPLERTRVFFVGDHGGNMDDRNATTGSRVYLPVYQPGALFAMGDVHATQGDGETLMGVEIDADITARVGLIKGQRVPGPRIETSDRWGIVAHGASMDEAMHLTAGRVASFLMERLGLTLEEATLVMCATVDFRVNSAIGGGYTVVMRAEVAKAIDRLGRL